MPWGRSFRRRTQAGSQPLHRQEPDAAPCHICAGICRFHVSVLRVFRHPQLENGFIPTVRFAAAINCFKGRRFDFRQMVTSVDGLPGDVREDQFFVG